MHKDAMKPPRIDLLVFEALQANAGAEFVLQLVEAFAEEAPLLAQQLRAAAASRDGAQFETIAHSLKSNGVTFGAERLAEMAGRLELQGLTGESAQTDAATDTAIDAAVGELVAEIAAVVLDLRAMARL
jgi:HPt (histidine-containing phosphotransfer) domain-containing protein